jgi:hypothetical protein
MLPTDEIYFCNFINYLYFILIFFYKILYISDTMTKEKFTLKKVFSILLFNST